MTYAGQSMIVQGSLVDKPNEPKSTKFSTHVEAIFPSSLVNLQSVIKHALKLSSQFLLFAACLALLSVIGSSSASGF